jgi:hypothetical protein
MTALANARSIKLAGLNIAALEAFLASTKQVEG